MRAWLLRHRIRVFVHRIRFPGAPMFSEAAAKDLIGKRVLVSVTHKTHRGQVVEKEAYQGRIVRATLSEGVVIQTPSGELRKLPADLRGFDAARPGKYESTASGEIVIDPDLKCWWTHTLHPPTQR